MEYEYEFLGKTIQLMPDTTRIAIRYKGEPDSAERVYSSMRAGLPETSEAIEIPGEKYTIYTIGEASAFFSNYSSLKDASLGNAGDIANIVPVFKLGDRDVLATDRVLAGIADHAATVFAYLHNQGCEILESRHGDRLIRIPEDSNPFEFAKALLEFDGVTYAEPDFVTLGRHIALKAPQTQITSEGKTDAAVIAWPTDGETTQAARNVFAAAEAMRPEPLAFHALKAGSSAALGDPLLSEQYAPRITESDVAWQSVVGDPRIKIAILDEGVDIGHEDLRARIAGSYDGISDTPSGHVNSWDGHGTACAGLAAAVPDNGIGIRGIGGGCSLLAVRIAESPSEGKPWHTTSNIIARSIDWAWLNGADILSNSWGGGTPSTAIYNAFERARIQGRRGKGAVIVVAAGNDAGPVSFPANLPNVLAVSASNEYDEFKTRASRDGEYWWGSNFGPEISVSAPGVHNLTTDIGGAGGYASGDYADFNGTSSACPIVAGAAGLILSANAGLSEAQVRQVILDSADKIDVYPYVGGRNDQHGHGRTNVRAAIARVLSMSNSPLGTGSP